MGYIYYLPRTSKLWHNSEHSNIPCIADKSNIKCNDIMQIKFQTAHCPRGWIMLPLGKPKLVTTPSVEPDPTLPAKVIPLQKLKIKEH
jgi:hypothetical protein